MDASAWNGHAASALESLMVSARYWRERLHPMTESQRFTLKMQIILFGRLSKRLAEMMEVEDSALPGDQPPVQEGPSRNASGDEYHAPVVDVPAMQKRPTSSKRNWRPSRKQLQILERYYKHLRQRNAHFDRNEISAISEEVSQHGNVTKVQVRNWFHNRKRKESRTSQASDALEEEPAEPDPLEQLQAFRSYVTASRIPAIIMFRGQSLEVEPDMYDVRGNFGHNVVLVDSGGNMVRMDASGVTMSPLEPGKRYTLHFHFDL